MGKVRKLRQKYHISLQKSKSLNNLTEPEKKDEIPKVNLFKSTENIFAGVDISWDDITKSLPKNFDVRSVVSSKSRKELKEEERHLKKKDKLKLRHERFMQKLDVARQLIQKVKSKTKKPKKPLEGDMSSLLEALPSLQSLAVDSSNKKSNKPKAKPKGIMKAKHRMKQQHYDTKLFKRILEDKKFRENPMEAVTQFLKQQVERET